MTACTLAENGARCPNEATTTRRLAGVDVAVCDLHDLAGGFIAAEYLPTFAGLVAAQVEADRAAALALLARARTLAAVTP